MGSYNADITVDFGIWNRKTKLGKVFTANVIAMSPYSGSA